MIEDDITFCSLVSVVIPWFFSHAYASLSLLGLFFVQVRGMKKRNEAAVEEAKLALQDLESLSKQLEGSSEAEDPNIVPSSGRMVFSGGGKPAPKSNNKTESDGRIKENRFYDSSDSEDHLEAEENEDPGDIKSDFQKDINVDPILLHEDSDIHQDSLFKVISPLVFHFSWSFFFLALQV